MDGINGQQDGAVETTRSPTNQPTETVNEFPKGTEHDLSECCKLQYE